MTIPWIIAAVFAGLALVAIAPPNAARGGFVVGLIAGLIHAKFFNEVFLKSTVFKWMIVCVLIGYLLEVIRRLGKRKAGIPLDD